MSVCWKCHRTIKGTSHIASVALSMAWCTCGQPLPMPEPPLPPDRSTTPSGRYPDRPSDAVHPEFPRRPGEDI